MLRAVVAIGMVGTLAGCDFTRAPGTSAWDGSSTPAGAAAAPHRQAYTAPPPPPPRSDDALAGASVAEARPVAGSTAPSVGGDPIPLSAPLPTATHLPASVGYAAAGPPIVMPPPVPRSVRMRGGLYRSFGDLGRLEITDGLRLTQFGTDTPTAWCATAGTDGLRIVGAPGVCFYDKARTGSLDTMAIISQPQYGYMETGPFHYSPLD